MSKQLYLSRNGQIRETTFTIVRCAPSRECLASPIRNFEKQRKKRQDATKRVARPGYSMSAINTNNKMDKTIHAFVQSENIAESTMHK